MVEMGLLEFVLLAIGFGFIGAGLALMVESVLARLRRD